MEVLTLADIYDNCIIAKNQDDVSYQMGIANFQVDFKEDPVPPSPPTPDEPDPEPPIVNPDPIFVTIQGQKILQSNDTDLNENHFEFILMQNDTILQAVTNNNNGLIVFDSICYTEPSENTYIIQEIPGEVNGMTYDDMIYNVIVSVSESNNTLIPEIVIKDGVGNKLNNITFTNVYIKPVEPKPEPPTPDEPEPPAPDEPEVKRILIREPTFGYGSFWMHIVEE